MIPLACNSRRFPPPSIARLGLLALVVAGCGESEAQRLKRIVPDAVGTTKVSGKVLVDGKPVKDLWVTFHPTDPSVKWRPRAQTDANGNFAMTTYNAGDGAPKGDWNITIEWLTYIKRASDWGGPDKLKNQYNNPNDTPFKVSIKDDKSIQLPTFELKLEGAEAKPAPPTEDGKRDAPVNVKNLKVF